MSGRPGWCSADSYTKSLEDAFPMARTNIEIDETLVRKARKLRQLKTKREIVTKRPAALLRYSSLVIRWLYTLCKMEV